jgi:hypothetical protein
MVVERKASGTYRLTAEGAVVPADGARGIPLYREHACRGER